MKLAVVVLMGLVALVVARPESTLDVEFDDFHHEQDIDDDNAFTGSYYWTSPEGVEFFVKYIADEDGFRILDSNAVPVSSAGVRADGLQGSFKSSEEIDDDDRK